MRDYRSNIEWRSIDRVIPYINNTKQHPESQIAKIAGSIAEFGFDQPLVVDGEGILIKGHGRLLAARQLGMTTVPVLVRTDLTPPQVKAARIADNKVAESGWETELLKLELVDLKASDFDLGLTGFDPLEIDELLTAQDYTQKAEDPTAETINKAAECQLKWQVAVGDLWQCGEHRILCSDCTETAKVHSLLDGSIVQLLLTDPPYGVKRDKGFTGAAPFRNDPQYRTVQRRTYTDEWDSERPSRETFKALLACAAEAIVWGGNFFADLLPMSTHWLVWDKHQTMPTFGDCELAWTSFDRKSVKQYDIEYNGLIGKEAERYHPTQKPVRLFSQLIDDYTDIGETIFDPYSGSGTTLIAAEQTGRIARLIEREPAYVAVALERWAQLMNQSPVKL